MALPLLLNRAFHAKSDIPAVLRQAPPRLRIHQAEVLGPSPLLLTALERRLYETGLTPSHKRSTGLVLASAGSTDPEAIAVIAEIARELRHTGWCAVRPAFASAVLPRTQDAVRDLRSAGVRPGRGSPVHHRAGPPPRPHRSRCQGGGRRCPGGGARPFGGAGAGPAHPLRRVTRGAAARDERLTHWQPTADGARSCWHAYGSAGTPNRWKPACLQHRPAPFPNNGGAFGAGRRVCPYGAYGFARCSRGLARTPAPRPTGSPAAPSSTYPGRWAVRSRTRQDSCQHRLGRPGRHRVGRPRSRHVLTPDRGLGGRDQQALPVRPGCPRHGLAARPRRNAGAAG